MGNQTDGNASSTASGAGLPVVGPSYSLWICPPTKHPVDPGCVRVALVENGQVKGGPGPVPVGLVFAGVIVAVLVGFFLARMVSAPRSV